MKKGKILASSKNSADQHPYRFFVILLLCVLATIVIGLTLINLYRSGKLLDNERIYVSNGVRDRNTSLVCHFGDTCFYKEQEDLYRIDPDGQKKKILTWPQLKYAFMACNSESVFLTRVGKSGIVRFDYEGNQMESNTKWDPHSFGEELFWADEEYLYYCDEADDGIALLDAETLEPTGIQFPNVDKQSWEHPGAILQTGMLQEDKRYLWINNKYSALFIGDEPASKFYGRNIGFLQEGDCLYYADTGTDYEYIARYHIPTKQFEKILIRPGPPEVRASGPSERFYPPMLNIDNENLIAVAVNYSAYGPDYRPFEEMMFNHKYDRVYVMDIDMLELQHDWTTRPKERILYADSEQVITYFEQEISFRRMEDWSVTSTRDASYIHFDRDKGSENYFSFELTGNKMFVFSEGKLLDVFDIR